MIKKIGKNIICALLEAQVKRLRRRNDFQLIVVSGSVGKTSTKLALVKTLSHRLRVNSQEGNYNDRLTVPMVIFGHTQPGLFNIPAYIKILLANERQIRKAYDYEVVVLEIGADAPGQLTAFAYLKPDLLVLTAIAAEHMEFFGSLENVAREELVPVSYSQEILVNLDDVPLKFLPKRSYHGYGKSKSADYRLVKYEQQRIDNQLLEIEMKGKVKLAVQTRLLGLSVAKALVAAAAVADGLGWSVEDIQAGLESVGPVAGRMQRLSGINDSVLIDDTYNASPIAVKAALDVLYEAPASQRIAILGSMNELGELSQAEHEAIGAACDPKRLDLVVTIGRDAEEYLGAAAEKAGCQVISFDSPYKAGQSVKEHLVKGSVVLAKGSQNGVFAEEALKQLLIDPTDVKKLVRQSAYWQAVKRKQFPSG